MLSDYTSLVHGISKHTVNGETKLPYHLKSSLATSYCKGEITSQNKVNGYINPPYLLDTIKLCANEEIHQGKCLASYMSSGECKNKHDTHYNSNNKVTPSSHDPSNYNDNTGMVEKSKRKMAPQLVISAVTSKTQDEIPSEELTFLSELPTEESTSYHASEANDYYPSGDNSRLPSPLPSNLTLEAPLSYPQYAPSDSPRGDPSIFLVQDPSLMFNKSPQKYQMDLHVVSNIISYAPEAALLQLESLNMLLRDAASTHPTYIPYLNEYNI